MRLSPGPKLLYLCLAGNMCYLPQTLSFHPVACRCWESEPLGRTSPNSPAACGSVGRPAPFAQGKLPEWRNVQ